MKIWRQGRDGRKEIAQEAVKMCEDEAWVKRLKAVNRRGDHCCYFHNLLLLVLILLLS